MRTNLQREVCGELVGLEHLVVERPGLLVPDQLEQLLLVGGHLFAPSGGGHLVGGDDEGALGREGGAAGDAGLGELGEIDGGKLNTTTTLDS